MDAPIEDLPDVARKRMEEIENRIGTVSKSREGASFLEKFYLGIGGPLAHLFVEKGREEADA